MGTTDILNQLTRFVVDQFLDGDASELTPETPLLEWGVLDSLSMLVLLSYIEQDLGIPEPDEHVRPEHFQNLGPGRFIAVTHAERRGNCQAGSPYSLESGLLDDLRGKAVMRFHDEVEPRRGQHLAELACLAEPFHRRPRQFRYVL